MSPISPQGSQWTGETNNYMASLGTTTAYLNVPPGCPTRRGSSPRRPAYGVQNITDGTSNTIAFGESLIGDNTIELVKWRDGPVSRRHWPGAGLLYDASRTPGGHDRPPSLPDGLHHDTNPTVRQARYNLKGFRWAENIGGFSLFNTIVPPNSPSIRSPGAYWARELSTPPTGNTRTPTATTPAAATSCSPTAACTSSSRRSPSRRTGAGDQGRRRGHLVR